MQINNYIKFPDIIKIILTTLLVGGLIGVLMGGVSIILMRLLFLSFTKNQELLLFFLFASLGLLMGLVEAGGRCLSWWRHTKARRKFNNY